MLWLVPAALVSLTPGAGDPAKAGDLKEPDWSRPAVVHADYSNLYWRIEDIKIPDWFVAENGSAQLYSKIDELKDPYPSVHE